MNENDDLKKLIETLPFFLHEKLKKHKNKDKLIEIVLDLGRRPEARFMNSTEYLSQKIISWQDIDYVTKQISKFSDENRAGIEKSLHRISCIRNRQFVIHGLTCRVGRAIFGTITVIRDLLESEKSLLILGKPGVGKTTIIREIARVLSDELERRVVIIDTSNEIAGDSDIPHSGIGRARRMQVAKTQYQHKVILEAVENHMPQVIIIDEIGNELEVLAARTIAEKGVQLVGTTHGNSLENLIKNPPLADLIGGIQYVTLSDEEAKRRGTQKSILERKAYPAFEIVIELNEQNLWTIHENVTHSIDFILRGEAPEAKRRLQRRHLVEQIRHFSLVEKIVIKSNKFFEPALLLRGKGRRKLLSQTSRTLGYSFSFAKLKSKRLVIYPYSISTNLLQEILLKLGFQFILTNEIRKASLIVGLKKNLKQNFKLIQFAKQNNIPIYSIHKISFYQISKLVHFLASQSEVALRV